MRNVMSATWLRFLFFSNLVFKQNVLISVWQKYATAVCRYIYRPTDSFDTFDPFNLISAWISNYMANKVWDEITYPFLNFNGATSPAVYNGCNYLSMLGLKLNHVSKRGSLLLEQNRGVFSNIGYPFESHLGPLLLTWFNFNPSMDK